MKLVELISSGQHSNAGLYYAWDYYFSREIDCTEKLRQFASKLSLRLSTKKGDKVTVLGVARIEEVEDLNDLINILNAATMKVVSECELESLIETTEGDEYEVTYHYCYKDEELHALTLKFNDVRELVEVTEWDKESITALYVKLISEVSGDAIG